MGVALENVELVAHPVSRSQARATRHIPAGSVVISVPAFAFSLLEVEKGRRCDACFRLPPDGGRLKKCTGCASYFYCGPDCQRMHWELEHKRVCKYYNKMISFAGFQQLAQHERMDAVLLSHFLARTLKTTAVAEDGDLSDPFSVFLSLLPGSHTPQVVLDTIPKSLTPQGYLTQTMYSRFSNNNFTIHSHMTTIGHGVFPLASRLFNHSCMPNAAPRYVLTPARPVIMEVVALQDISLGEEICVPYLDPALTQSRHQAFQYTYGFTCECSSCIVIRKLGQAPKPPDSPDAITSVGEGLRNYVGIGNALGPDLSVPSLADLPTELRCVLHESYMEQLSEQFSKASHEGDYATAVISGHTLLALYLLIYPRNYPQIGLHLLELAKAGWNALVSSKTSGADIGFRSQVPLALGHARKILQLYGREGDEYGPLDEGERLDEFLME